MPNLVQSLQTRDLGHLRIVAGLWGVELGSAEIEAALKELTSALLDPDLVGEMVDSLSAEAQSALERLVEAGGKMPWAAFARQFGEIREAGPGRRDREQGYLNPVSAAETLFYRAFLARAFFDTAGGAQEFAYIPEDLAKLIKSRIQQRTPGEAHRAAWTTWPRSRNTPTPSPLPTAFSTMPPPAWPPCAWGWNRLNCRCRSRWLKNSWKPPGL